MFLGFVWVGGAPFLLGSVPLYHQGTAPLLRVSHIPGPRLTLEAGGPVAGQSPFVFSQRRGLARSEWGAAGTGNSLNSLVTLHLHSQSPFP